MRTLIVDDDVTSRYSIETVIRKYGQCDQAKNGEEAINLFRTAYSEKKPYNLITLDLMIPDMSGPTVYSNIRKIEETFNVLRSERVDILIVTIQDYLGKVMKSKLGGRTNYLVKPFNPDNLKIKLTDLGFSMISDDDESENEELKQFFLQEFSRRIKKLHHYLKSTDLINLLQLGHQLHGTGATYGFNEVTVLGAELEEAVKKGDWAEITKKVNALTILNRSLT